MATLHTIRCVRLYILRQNGNRESIDELARRFGVTRRQIFRDLALLRKAEQGFDLPSGSSTDGKPGLLHKHNGQATETSNGARRAQRGGKAAAKTGKPNA